jgi:hypothetical protein
MLAFRQVCRAISFETVEVSGIPTKSDAHLPPNPSQLVRAIQASYHSWANGRRVDRRRNSGQGNYFSTAALKSPRLFFGVAIVLACRNGLATAAYPFVMRTLHNRNATVTWLVCACAHIPATATCAHREGDRHQYRKTVREKLLHLNSFWLEDRD